MIHRRKLYITILLVIGVVSACATGDAQKENSGANPAASPVAVPFPAKTFTEADIAKLKWIVGSWRGTGVAVDPFYEKYSFRNASTLAADSFDDESLKKQIDTSLFTLQDGHFGNSYYSLSEITDDSATFVPIISTAKNGFVWKKESDSVWKATLTWPQADGKPAREKVYTMTRIEEQH